MWDCINELNDFHSHNPDEKTQLLCCLVPITYTNCSLVMRYVACYIKRLFMQAIVILGFQNCKFFSFLLLSLKIKKLVVKKFGGPGFPWPHRALMALRNVSIYIFWWQMFLKNSFYIALHGTAISFLIWTSCLFFFYSLFNLSTRFICFDP